MASRFICDPKNSGHFAWGSRCSLLRSSCADQGPVRGPLDDFGNGCFPGFAASSPDSHGEVDEVLRQGLGMAIRGMREAHTCGKEGDGSTAWTAVTPDGLGMDGTDRSITDPVFSQST